MDRKGPYTSPFTLIRLRLSILFKFMKNKLPYKFTQHYWWIAIIALAVSVVAVYFIEPDPYNPTTQKLRILLPAVGIIVAGICLIMATADRWFK